MVICQELRIGFIHIPKAAGSSIRLAMIENLPHCYHEPLQHFHKFGVEGGQMPLQRRLPKVGFSSRKSRFIDELRLHELGLVNADVIDLAALQEANLVSRSVKRVKVIASGSIDKAVKLKGIEVTKGARAAIEAAGGSIED